MNCEESILATTDYGVGLTAAVQRGPEGTYVYAVDADGTARVQAVAVAQIQDGVAVIDQGLAAGQRVVVDGQYKLRPGLKVVEAPRAAASEAGR